MTSFKQRRFQNNAAFLAEYFADISKMDGIIIKIEVEEPYINYANTFGDPVQEQTLRLADTNNNTILLYKADRRVPKHNIMRSYRFTENDTVSVHMVPAVVPKILGDRIFHDHIDNISQALKRTQLTDKVSMSAGVDRFLNMHFVHGDMTPLSVMTRKQDYRLDGHWLG
jgi:hypothetical protein